MKAISLDTEDLPADRGRAPPPPAAARAAVPLHRVHFAAPIGGYLGKMPFFISAEFPATVGVEVLAGGTGSNARPDPVRSADITVKSAKLLFAAATRFCEKHQTLGVSTATAGCGPQFIVPARSSTFPKL